MQRPDGDYPTLAGVRNLLHPLRRRQVVFCNPTDHPLVEMALRTLRQEGYEVAAKPHRYIEEGTAYAVDADLLQPPKFTFDGAEFGSQGGSDAAT
jgi:hypothetical protein